MSPLTMEVAPVWSPSQAAVHREARRKSHFYTYMNLWPFVGVLLVLLFAFMGAFGWVHGDVPVDVPSAFHATRQPKAGREGAVEVSLTRDGRVLFRDTRVLPKSLPILIRGAVQDGAEKKVYLAVDARAKYGDAAAVVDAIARAGINQICFLAYKRER